MNVPTPDKELAKACRQVAELLDQFYPEDRENPKLMHPDFYKSMALVLKSYTDGTGTDGIAYVMDCLMMLHDRSCDEPWELTGTYEEACLWLWNMVYENGGFTEEEEMNLLVMEAQFDREIGYKPTDDVFPKAI
jgi:hypothetical protein